MKKIMLLMLFVFMVLIKNGEAQNVVFDENTQMLSTDIKAQAVSEKEVEAVCEKALDNGREILKEWARNSNLGLKFYGCYYKIVEREKTENGAIFLKIKVETKYYYGNGKSGE